MLSLLLEVLIFIAAARTLSPAGLLLVQALGVFFFGTHTMVALKKSGFILHISNFYLDQISVFQKLLLNTRFYYHWQFHIVCYFAKAKVSWGIMG